MKYVILDLNGTAPTAVRKKGFLNEIIEFGAVKLMTRWKS